MKKIVLTLVFMASLLWAASSGHYSWDQSSAEYVFVIIPAGYTPTIDSVEIENGDEIALFTPTGECAGALSWAGSATNVAVNAWEDNGSTSDSTEGFKSGDQITFRIWDSSESKEYVAMATYTVGDGTYNGNDVYYEVSSIFVNIPDTTAYDTSWHIIYKDTVTDITSDVTVDKDTVVTTVTKEFTSDTLYEQIDSLSDGVVYSSDTTKSITDNWLTLDSVVVVNVYKPDTTVFDTSWHVVYKDTIDEVTSEVTAEKDTVITTTKTENISDTLYEQTDSLSDSFVYKSDTTTSVTDSSNVLSVSVDTSYYISDTTIQDSVVYDVSKSDTIINVDTAFTPDTIITTISIITSNDTTITQIDSLKLNVVFSTTLDTIVWDTTVADTVIDTLLYDDPVAIEKEDVDGAVKKVSVFALSPSVIDPKNTEEVTFYISKEKGLSVETFEIAIFDMVGNVMTSIDESHFIVKSDNDYLEMVKVPVIDIRDDVRVAGQFLAVVKLRLTNGSIERYKQFIGIKK